MKPTIEFSDFDKVDIRVGTITEVSLPDWSEKLIELKVDFGEEIGIRTIFSGIRAFFQPQDLQGKQSVFLVNLAPKKMGPGVSEGMMMLADGDRPILLTVSKKVENGSVIR